MRVRSGNRVAGPSASWHGQRCSSRARERHIAVEGTEHDWRTAFAAPADAARLAAAMPFRPRRDLGVDDLALDGGRHCFSFGERQPEVLRPLCRLLKRCHFFSQAGGAVISGDLEQDPDVHAAPPLLIARERVSHKSRSGKPKRVQHNTRSYTLPHLGPRQPSVCTPDTIKQTGTWPLSSVLPPPSLPSSSARAWTTPRARPCSKPPGRRPACTPRPSAAAP